MSRRKPDPDPFEAWRQAVRLDAGFPRLGSLNDPLPHRNKDGREVATDDSRRLFLEGQLAEDARRVYQSLGGSRAVLTAPGHGATTLARWAYHQAHADAIVRRAIPVLLSIEDLIEEDYAELLAAEAEFLVRHHPHLAERRFMDPEDEDAVWDFQEAADKRAEVIFGKISAPKCREAIESRLRFEVVRSLATQPWELATGSAAYRDLLGLSVASQDAFEDTRAKLSGLYNRMPLGHLPEGEAASSFWQQLANLAAPLANTDFAQQIRDLNNSCQVRISLILDLSATPMGRQYVGDPPRPNFDGSPPDQNYGGEYMTRSYTNVLKNMHKAIKNIEDEGSRGPQPTVPSLLDKTYVLSSTAWPEFKAEFKAHDDARVEFSPFRPLDLFAVLAYHYPPEENRDTGRRVELLAAVLDSYYLQITPLTAISTETVLLRETVRENLKRRGYIPYQQRVRDEDEIKALEWAVELWRQSLSGRNEDARAFLEQVLPESTLTRLRGRRDGSDGSRPRLT